MTKDSGTPAGKQPRPSIESLLGCNVVSLAHAHRFAVTIFGNRYAKRKPEVRDHTLRSLANVLEDEHADLKHGSRSLKLALYGDERTGRGSLRSNANTLEVWGCEIDCEDKPSEGWRSHPIPEIERRVRAARLNALVYPTGSHTESETHARVILPYSRAIAPEEHARFVARIAGVLDGLVDPHACYTLSQPVYFGHKPGKTIARVEIIEGGRWLDACKDLDAGALSKADVKRIQRKAPAKPDTRCASASKTDKRKRWFDDDEQLARALKLIPNDGGRDEWLNTIFSIYAETNGSEVGRAIAEEWSDSWDGEHKPGSFEGAWRRPDTITGEYVYDLARSHGWPYAAAYMFDDPGPPEESEATERDRPHPLSIAGMNERYAVADMAGQSVIVVRRTGRIDFTSKQALHDWHHNKRRLDKEKAVSASVLWFASPRRKEYPNGVIFDPSGKGEDGALNLWTGWGVKPDPGASCKLILKHIREVISGGDAKIFDYNVKYDAHLVQRPREKPRVARVLRGTEGVGKDSYGRLIARIVGARHTAHIGDGTRLTARFNSIFEAALFGWLEEAYFAGDKRERGKLYHLITSPDVAIERKGLEAFQVDSFLRLLMTTNESWAVPAGADARRFAVFDVADTYKGSSKKSLDYFNALHAEIEGDGAGAYLAYLQDVDLAGFDVRAIPQTAALDDQKRHSLAPLERWWERVMESGRLWEEGFDEGTAGKEDLYSNYCTYVRELRFGGEPMIVSMFWKAFRTMCPGVQFSRPRSGTQRKHQVRLPTLTTCKGAFERHIGVRPSWEALIG